MESKFGSRLPVLFIGHGSPMNALAVNSFTKSLTDLSKRFARPKAVLCISAHWMTEGSWVTHMERPKTIHDFYGFPPALFEVRYPAPGSPELAELIHSSLKSSSIQLDDEQWGLDHGTWSVLKHVYPEANIPVVQLSLHMEQSVEYHYELGKNLRFLRDQGILIVGSGNVVHNLRKIRWEEDAAPYDWAVEFDAWVKRCLQNHDHPALIHEFNATQAGRLSVPTPEHYYPFLYALGASDETDRLQFEYEGLQNGSISMLSVSWGA